MYGVFLLQRWMVSLEICLYDLKQSAGSGLAWDARSPGNPGKAGSRGMASRAEGSTYARRGTIRTLAGNIRDVAFRGTGGGGMVSLAGESPACGCPYHTAGKECRYKHITAVEHMLFIKSQPAHGKGMTVGGGRHAPAARIRNTPATDGTAANTKTCRSASVPYAGGGSEGSLGFECRRV